MPENHDKSSARRVGGEVTQRIANPSAASPENLVSSGASVVEVVSAEAQTEREHCENVDKPRRASRKSPARIKRADHALLWVLVEGAVMDAFTSHPEYLTLVGRRSAVESVTKRVVGQMVGYIAGASAPLGPQPFLTDAGAPGPSAEASEGGDLRKGRRHFPAVTP